MASTPYSDIPLPKEVTDPLYTSSQAGLNTLGSGLLTGNIPDYYKSIGDFNSPQFQAMLNSVKGQIMQGSQESSAINGTGRSGVATTASNNSLNAVLPNLTYQDYLRAMQGRGALLGLGADVQTGVRGSAQNQQQYDSNFNQQIYQDQIQQAGLIDDYKKQASAAQGQMIGGIASFISPAFGPSIGQAFGANSYQPSGGNAGLSSLFSSLANMGGQSSQIGGNSLVSQLGSFGGGTSIGSGTSAIDALFKAGVPLALSAV